MEERFQTILVQIVMIVVIIDKFPIEWLQSLNPYLYEHVGKLLTLKGPVSQRIHCMCSMFLTGQQIFLLNLCSFLLCTVHLFMNETLNIYLIFH